MEGYCNYFNCFCEYEIIEQMQEEFGEHCLMDCELCEYHER